MEKRIWVAIFLVVALAACDPNNKSQEQETLGETHIRAPFALSIHGGAGTIKRGSMTPEQEAASREKMQESLNAGYSVLDAGGTALEAVIASIKIMEDSPLFNAGKGSVFTHEETNEMDAAIMDGATRNAGAVAALP